MSNNNGFYAHPEYYDILFDWDRTNEIMFLSACLEHYGIAEEEIVLEIACGTGLVSIPLAYLGWKLQCLDISQPMLDKMMDKLKGGTFPAEIVPVCADMMKFELEKKVKAAFCTIGSIGLMENVSDMIDHLKAVHLNMEKSGIYIIDIGIVEGETVRSNYNEVVWGMERDGILVEAENGKVYVNSEGMTEKEFSWEAVPYEFNPDHFTELVKESGCYEILAWHEENELNEDGVSLFDINHTVEKPKKRSMVVLRAN